MRLTHCQSFGQKAYPPASGIVLWFHGVLADGGGWLAHCNEVGTNESKISETWTIKNVEGMIMYWNRMFQGLAFVGSLFFGSTVLADNSSSRIDFGMSFCKETAESSYDKCLVDCRAGDRFDDGSCEATCVYNLMESLNKCDRKGLSRASVCQSINRSVDDLKFYLAANCVKLIQKIRPDCVQAAADLSALRGAVAFYCPPPVDVPPVQAPPLPKDDDLFKLNE